MKICVKCKREMDCDKNSVGADFGNGHVYPTDRFKCPECGHTVLDSGTVKAIHDPDHKTQEEYLGIVR